MLRTDAAAQRRRRALRPAAACTCGRTLHGYDLEHGARQTSSRLRATRCRTVRGQDVLPRSVAGARDESRRNRHPHDQANPFAVAGMKAGTVPFMTDRPASTTTPGHRCFALVPCAGIGARAGGCGPKQYASVGGRPMVEHTLSALMKVSRIEATLVVLSPQDDRFERCVPTLSARPDVWAARCGGASRALSVAAGLSELTRRGVGDNDWVLVHDAARCLIRPEWIDRLIDACLGDEVGGLLAVPVADTLKRELDGRAAASVDRNAIWSAQTPQMFRLGMLRRALSGVTDRVTDESGAIERAGYAPKLVAGHLANFKLTWPDDFALAESLLQAPHPMVTR